MAFLHRGWDKLPRIRSMTPSPNKQLLAAAVAGDLKTVGYALGLGADVNAKDEYNNTALNSAALRGHAELVKLLIDAGADIENPGSGGGLTPLANAASRDHYEAAKILLDHGARVTNDLLSLLQTKVNIMGENYEGGMVTEEGVKHWQAMLEFFGTERIKQDLPGVAPHLTSTNSDERRDTVAQVAEGAKRGLDITVAAPHLPALLSDADPDTRREATRALTYHLARAGQWPGVREILSSTDARLRLAAVGALTGAKRADTSLLQPLGDLLQDSDAEVRNAAAIAVGTLPGNGIDATSLLPGMIKLLADADPLGRRGSAFAFRMWSRAGLHQYCSAALPTLRSLAENDDNEAVRRFAAYVVDAEDASER
jgi:hypothetical protein